jgi:hypothetical protein
MASEAIARGSGAADTATVDVQAHAIAATTMNEM